MPKVTYVLTDEAKYRVDVPVGESVMRGAVDSGVPGIMAECGGQMSCATCHVHVAKEWSASFDAAGPDEVDMLDLVEDLEETSRLSCQLTALEEHDGLIVHVPGT